jgi:hypothetical protein
VLDAKSTSVFSEMRCALWILVSSYREFGHAEGVVRVSRNSSGLPTVATRSISIGALFPSVGHSDPPIVPNSRLSGARYQLNIRHFNHGTVTAVKVEKIFRVLFPLLPQRLRAHSWGNQGDSFFSKGSRFYCVFQWTKRHLVMSIVQSSIGFKPQGRD